MLDFLHPVGSYIALRLMLLMALPITFLTGAVTILIVGIILKPRETTRLLCDETVGRISRWLRPSRSS